MHTSSLPSPSLSCTLSLSLTHTNIIHPQIHFTSSPHKALSHHCSSTFKGQSRPPPLTASPSTPRDALSWHISFIGAKGSVILRKKQEGMDPWRENKTPETCLTAETREYFPALFRTDLQPKKNLTKTHVCKARTVQPQFPKAWTIMMATVG